MPDISSIHPLGDLDALAKEASNPEVMLTVRTGISCAQIFAKKGQADKLSAALKIGTAPGVATGSRNFTALSLSPNQWMLLSKKPESDFAGVLARKISSMGHVSNQSDSRVCFRISGPRAVELMSRGCRLDLHSSVMPDGFCAQTTMAQVGVLLHKTGPDTAYDLYVYSGFARSFWNWLSHTAGQFNHSVAVERL